MLGFVFFIFSVGGGGLGGCEWANQSLNCRAPDKRGY